MLDRLQNETLIYDSVLALVYRAFDSNFQKSVCVKHADWSYVRDEFKVLSRFDHPHIAVPITAFEHRRLAFSGVIITEDAGPCVNYKVGERETIYMATKVCRALTVIHSQDVIHNDVKPDNICLFKNAVGLIDFNSAVFDGQPSCSGGTYGYIAPEKSEGKVSPLVDIYGLGATMAFWLTGRTPPTCFNRKYFSDLFFKQCDLDVISPNLVALVEKAMAMDVNDRFQSADEMADALLRLQ